MPTMQSTDSCLYDCVEYNLENVLVEMGEIKIVFDLKCYSLQSGSNSTLFRYYNESDTSDLNLSVVWTATWWSEQSHRKVQLDLQNAECFPLLCFQSEFLILVVVPDKPNAYLSMLEKPTNEKFRMQAVHRSLTLQMKTSQSSSLVHNNVTAFCQPASRQFAKGKQGKPFHRQRLFKALQDIFNPSGSQERPCEKNAAVQVNRIAQARSRRVPVTLTRNIDPKGVDVSSGTNHGIMTSNRNCLKC